MRLRSVLHVLLAAILLAACTSRDNGELLTIDTRPAAANAIAAKHEIFVATTRAKSQDALKVFGGDRSQQTDFAKVGVTVPAIHQVGQIERRRGKIADPAKYFTATDVSVYSEPAFRKALRADLARNNGRALVFIHGFNTSFDSAVYRVTQIVHDADYTGTPVLFSWASRGEPLAYVYDNNSATAARDSLESLLRLLSASGARSIDIIAHSMGNWVTVESLRQLAIAGDPTLGGKIDDVLLASPDIDVDVFKSQMIRYGRPKKPFIILLSDDDRALRFSSLIAGDRPRLGDYSDPQEIAKYGAVVVNLTQLKGDRLSHTKFAENPVMIKLIGEGLKQDTKLENDRDITDRVNQLTSSFGQTLTSAAEIVVTTPVSVLRIAVGG